MVEKMIRNDIFHFHPYYGVQLVDFLNCNKLWRVDTTGGKNVELRRRRALN